MTLYLLFEQLEDWHAQARHAAADLGPGRDSEPTKLGLKANQTVKVEDAIKGSSPSRRTTPRSSSPKLSAAPKKSSPSS
jgi:hypothetical protein